MLSGCINNYKKADLFTDTFRGHLSNFSIARLIKFLILLEQDIEITVKDRSNNYEPFGHLKVILNDFHTKENFNNTQKHS